MPSCSLNTQPLTFPGVVNRWPLPAGTPSFRTGQLLPHIVPFPNNPSGTTELCSTNPTTGFQTWTTFIICVHTCACAWTYMYLWRKAHWPINPYVKFKLLLIVSHPVLWSWMQSHILRVWHYLNRHFYLYPNSQLIMPLYVSIIFLANEDIMCPQIHLIQVEKRRSFQGLLQSHPIVKLLQRES